MDKMKPESESTDKKPSKLANAVRAGVGGVMALTGADAAAQGTTGADVMKDTARQMGKMVDVVKDLQGAVEKVPGGGVAISGDEVRRLTGGKAVFIYQLVQKIAKEKGWSHLSNFDTSTERTRPRESRVFYVKFEKDPSYYVQGVPTGRVGGDVLWDKDIPNIKEVYLVPGNWLQAK